MKPRALLSTLLLAALLPLGCGDGAGPSVGPSAPAVKSDADTGKDSAGLSKQQQKKREKMGGVKPSTVD